jgi:hypothetical protein
MREWGGSSKCPPLCMRLLPLVLHAREQNLKTLHLAQTQLHFVLVHPSFFAPCTTFEIPKCLVQNVRNDLVQSNSHQSSTKDYPSLQYKLLVLGKHLTTRGLGSNKASAGSHWCSQLVWA